MKDSAMNQALAIFFIAAIVAVLLWKPVLLPAAALALFGGVIISLLLERRPR